MNDTIVIPAQELYDLELVLAELPMKKLDSDRVFTCIQKIRQSANDLTVSMRQEVFDLKKEIDELKEKKNDS